MSGRKHVATYPLYGSFPISGGYNTRNRIGTGYVYSFDDIDALEARLRSKGHPLRLRWRNDDVHTEFCAWANAKFIAAGSSK